MRGIGPFLKDAWHLSRPYFMTSEERWSARGLLVAIIAMNLTLVGLSVVLSFWRREFYNALQDKDWKAFLELLFLYRQHPKRSDAGVLRGRLGAHRAGGLLGLPEPVAADPLAPLADSQIPDRVAGGPSLLPHQPDGGSGQRSAPTTRTSA